MDTLNIIKTIIEMATSLIGTLFPPIKALMDARSEASKKVMEGFTEVATMMGTPDEREKVDVERLRVLAEYTEKIIPFAWVEYAFFATKVATVVALMIYISERNPFGRQR